MPATIEKILTEIEELPTASKEMLAEKILEIIDRDKNFHIEKEQLDEVKRRRTDILLKKATPVDGEKALQQARSILNEI